jgi:hypothetical protein
MTRLHRILLIKWVGCDAAAATAASALSRPFCILPSAVYSAHAPLDAVYGQQPSCLLACCRAVLHISLPELVPTCWTKLADHFVLGDYPDQLRGCFL